MANREEDSVQFDATVLVLMCEELRQTLNDAMDQLAGFDRQRAYAVIERAAARSKAVSETSASSSSPVADNSVLHLARGTLDTIYADLRGRLAKRLN